MRIMDRRRDSCGFRNGTINWLTHSGVIRNVGPRRSGTTGAATYGLSWFDVHLWAYAEVNGLVELVSEDFQPGRMYGTVTVRNPVLLHPD